MSYDLPQTLRTFRPSRRLGLCVALLWLAGLATAASAAVKLSNLETALAGSATVTATLHKAQPFKTTATGPFEITTLTLRMGAGRNGAGQFSVAIYAGELAPTALVPNGRLAGEDNPLTAGNYTYTASGLTLDPNTTYWIVASVTSGPGSYSWAIANSATYQIAEWTKVERFGESGNAGSSWNTPLPALPYYFAISNAATGTITFAGADNFDDNDLGPIAPGSRWRFNTGATGTTGTAFTNQNGALDFTSTSTSRAARFLGWITPTSSGGSYGYDWVATIKARNVTNPSSGFTLAGLEVYTLNATNGGGSNSYYGLYLSNSAGAGGTRILAERGIYSASAGDFVRSSSFTAMPNPGQNSGALRLQWTAATRTLVASYTSNGRDFITVRTFALGGADAGPAGPFANGFGLQLTGVADGGARAAAGEINFDDMEVTTNIAPAIAAQPASIVVTAGQAASFGADVSGSRPLTYQWFRNDVAIVGATSPALRLPSTTAADAGAYKLTATNNLGTVTSAAATLTVNTPLTITTQPRDTSASTGNSASFTVAATASSALSYQWRRNGVSLPGATAATLTINPVTAASYATYSVLVSSTTGGLESASAQLLSTSVPATVPTITQQPRGVTINAGATLVLSVAATGIPAPTYQWNVNGATIPGATSATLVLNNAQAADSGAYTATVSTLLGRITSEAAVVTVGDGFSRQLNISTRGFAGIGADTLIPAFVISGANPKRLLIRAAGPALAAFGVGGTIADPQIAVVSNGTQVLTNDNWSTDTANAAVVRAAATSVGAFPFAEGSKDAAVVVTLPPGSGSILVTGVGGATGEAIVEVYDLDESDAARSRLVNLSTRAFVPATGNPLISGFVVQGLVAKAVLIRATGPALAGFGLPGTLAQPKLTIFNNDGVALATNTGWESSGIANAIITASTSVGAFPLTRGSADSVVLAVLPPGNYTAQIVGADGTAGVALVEVYELP